MTPQMTIERNISNRIEPNYSSWQTIELSYQFAKQMVDEGIAGDVVETGVACGNNFAAMCAAGRHGVGFDSFEGIPWAGPEDDQQPGMSEIPKIREGISSGITSHSIEDGVKNMERWGIKDYEFVKGWFKDTLPVNTIEKISVLRLDGDLYESTWLALEHLYPKLSKGGILIIDDWNLSGCRKAFDNYFKKKGPTEITYQFNVKYLRK